MRQLNNFNGGGDDCCNCPHEFGERRCGCLRYRPNSIGFLNTAFSVVFKGIVMKAFSVPRFGFSLSMLLVFSSSGVLAQSSPWGTVISPQQYVNPDTGQSFCFYSSSTWAPCPNQGTAVIKPPPGTPSKCVGGTSMEDFMNHCPAARCQMESISDRLSSLSTGSSGSPPLPCNGLP